MTDLRQDELPNIQSKRYKILSVLGAGGAGIVFKAHDTLLDKDVAIKKLHRTATRSESLRFQREAKMAATLNHPHVSTILDFGLTERHEPYMVLDYIEGQSLSSYLKDVETLRIDEALAIFIQIAEGLSHAHRKRVIHRDVTPNNIMLVDSDGKKSVKIVDFGLAKSTEEDQDLTKSGVGIGTPLYMSPEQIRGKNVDQRSDIYSFGCLMYQALRGMPPFESDNILGLIDMHLNSDPPPLRVISLDKAQGFQIEELIMRCLQKKPSDRYQSIDEVLVVLKQAASPQEKMTEAAPKLQQRKEYYGYVTAVGLLFLSAGFLILNIFKERTLSEPLNWTPKVFFGKIENAEKYKDGTLSDVVLNTGSPKDKPKPGSYLSSDEILSNDETLVDFARKHPDATDLDIATGNRITSEGLAALRDLPLKSLVLKRCKLLSMTAFEHIVTLKQLKLLKLIDIGDIDWHGFLELKKNKELRELAIIDCYIDSNTYEALSKLEQLTRFELKNCRGLKVFELGKLSGLKRLNTLTIVDTGESIRDFDKIAHLPIETIDLSGSPIAPEELKKIAAIKTLREFTICFYPVQITPEMFAEFRRLRPDVTLKENWRP